MIHLDKYSADGHYVMLIGRMGVQEYVIREETRQELADALNTLSDAERDVLIRRYYYEQKPRDIAVALDMPVKQINNYLYRSKQKLRQAVSGKEVHHE